MDSDIRIVTFQPIPARAEAREQYLQQIREDTTLSERINAWSRLAKLPGIELGERGRTA